MYKYIVSSIFKKKVDVSLAVLLAIAIKLPTTCNYKISSLPQSTTIQTNSTSNPH